MGENENNNNNWIIAKKLYNQYVKGYWRNIIIAILAMVIVAATTGMNAYLIQPMLDKIFIEHDHSMLQFITTAIIINAVINGAASYMQSLTVKSLGQKILTNMQMHLYEHLIYHDVSLIQQNNKGNLISRFTNDIGIMRMTVSSLITGVAKDASSVFVLIGVMFYQDWQLALMAFVVFPLSFYPIIKLGKKMKKYSLHTQEQFGNYTSKLDQTFQNYKIIKSYNAEASEIARAEQIVNKILSLFIRSARTQSLASPIIEVMTGISIGFIVLYGGNQVITNSISAGSFFSFIAATIMAYKPIKSLMSLNASLQEGLAASKRFFNIIEFQPKIIDKPNAIEFKARSDTTIKFNNVSYKFPEQKDELLENFDLVIPSGKTVAFIGESGSGKSTLINLLLRFYEPTEGEINIDGININNITLKSLRNVITLVNQEVNLFDDSIFNNIKYGNQNASDQEVMKAANLAMVTDFTDEMDENIYSYIGNNGMNLSGGQRQRIAIARAILKNSPIMILDEATSALDNLTEAKVINNIEQLRHGKTTIVIAHRLSTIKNADIIHVLEKGNLIESGNHHELLEKHGLYAQFYNKIYEKK